MLKMLSLKVATMNKITIYSCLKIKVGSNRRERKGKLLEKKNPGVVKPLRLN